MKTNRGSFQRLGFTLVEVLLSTAIIGLILLILVSITSQTAQTWRYTTGKIEQFREARVAFDRMTTQISQATLNTYWDYDNATAPKRYERRSELRYINGSVNGSAEQLLGNSTSKERFTHGIFFHAPLGFVANTGPKGYRGLENLLNVWGYYVELGDDADLRPPFITPTTAPLRTRFRLMEFMQPSEKMTTYSFTSGVLTGKPNSETYTATSWFKAPINSATPANSPLHVLAENVVALIILPQLSKQDIKAMGSSASELAANYSYDSTKKGANRLLNPKNQLPPVVQVTMVAVDEASAVRMNPADLSASLKKFSKAADFNKDLKLDLAGDENSSLENKLTSKAVKANYRIFTTNVPIRAAKWSRSQTN